MWSSTIMLLGKGLLQALGDLHFYGFGSGSDSTIVCRVSSSCNSAFNHWAVADVVVTKFGSSGSNCSLTVSLESSVWQYTEPRDSSSGRQYNDGICRSVCTPSLPSDGVSCVSAQSC